MIKDKRLRDLLKLKYAETINGDDYISMHHMQLVVNTIRDSIAPDGADGHTYQDTLENGLIEICNAMGVSGERYDTDQADIECYMDCFREAAKLIKKAGYNVIPPII